MRCLAPTTVAVCVLVAACSDGRASAPVASQSASTTTSAVATTSSVLTTSTSTTTAPKDILAVTSTLRADGIGPVSVGMTSDEVRAAAGVDLTEDNGPFCGGLESPSVPGLVLLLIDNHVALMLISGPDITTSTGLHVGSTEADVLAASPGADVRNPSEPVHRVVVAADQTVSIVFNIEDGVVFHIAAGLRTATEADEACA